MQSFPGSQHMKSNSDPTWQASLASNLQALDYSCHLSKIILYDYYSKKYSHVSSVFMKDRCQIIVIYGYFETGSKPHRFVHTVYEDCIQLTLYLRERKTSTF